MKLLARPANGRLSLKGPRLLHSYERLEGGAQLRMSARAPVGKSQGNWPSCKTAQASKEKVSNVLDRSCKTFYDLVS